MGWKQEITKTLGRSLLQVKVNSPHIFFGLGVVGVVGAGAWACKSTLKLSDTLDDIQHDVEQVKTSKARVHDIKQSYSEVDYNKDIAYVYGKAAVKLGKLYGPPIVLGAVSVTLLTGSHVQLTRRNSALTAAYVTLQEAYNEYRERVRREIGEEAESRVHRGVETKVIKGEDGKNKKVEVMGKFGTSPYARIYDEQSTEFIKDAEHNRFFITCQQNQANNMLHARGHLFLNEVYDMLGFDHTAAGAVVGWYMDNPSSPDCDNFVDFGVYEAYNQDNLINEEPRLWLDFNVDGVINHLLKNT